MARCCCAGAEGLSRGVSQAGQACAASQRLPEGRTTPQGEGSTVVVDPAAWVGVGEITHGCEQEDRRFGVRVCGSGGGIGVGVASRKTRSCTARSKTGAWPPSASSGPSRR